VSALPYSVHLLGTPERKFATRDAALDWIAREVREGRVGAGSWGDYEVLDGSD
jgi:hypothetical protein